MLERIRHAVDAPIGLAALGGTAWVVAGFYYSAGALQGFVLGLILATLGLGLAAWALPRWRPATAAGWVIVLMGMVLFIGPGLLQLTNAARVGSHVFCVALVVFVGATFVPSHGGRWIHRIGCGLAVVAGVLWIVADMDGGLAWQPGNVLVIAAFCWSAVRPPRR